jgi:intracellular sulfur oxidation DsrE/DsrF family protein
MKQPWVIGFVAAGLLSGTACAESKWPPAVAPVVADADGYVAIPNVAVPPDRKRVYRAIFDATQGSGDPKKILPALNMAGSELNAFGAAGVPLRNAKFVVVFHGAALDGILDNAHYRTKFSVDNPNLEVLAAMKATGVKFFVCGQNLAAEQIDPATLSSDVTVASDALIVLMSYQNDGYALLSF